MPLMTWTDKLSVGVEVLDRDHRHLVDMVNTLFDGIQAGEGQAAVGSILDDLVAYTVEHFRREEDLMAHAGYPDAAAHKEAHARLCRQVLDIQAKYRSGATPTLSLEVMHFLKNWLTNHIQGSDRHYAPLLNAKGVR